MERLAFLYYINAQCLADQKCFVEALDSFSHASELSSCTVKYTIGRSVLWYFANILIGLTVTKIIGGGGGGGDGYGDGDDDDDADADNREG